MGQRASLKVTNRLRFSAASPPGRPVEGPGKEPLVPSCPEGACLQWGWPWAPLPCAISELMKWSLPRGQNSLHSAGRNAAATQGLVGGEGGSYQFISGGVIFSGVFCPSVSPEARVLPAPGRGSPWGEPGTLQSIRGSWPGWHGPRALQTTLVTGLDSPSGARWPLQPCLDRRADDWLGREVTSSGKCSSKREPHQASAGRCHFP